MKDMNPNQQNPEIEQDIPPDLLERVLKESSRKAIDETFALGLPIMVEKDGILVEIYPDGTEKVVQE